MWQSWHEFLVHQKNAIKYAYGYDCHTSGSQHDGSSTILWFNKPSWVTQYPLNIISISPTQTHIYESTNQNQRAKYFVKNSGENGLFSVSIMNCHQKHSVTQKAIFRPLSITTPLPLSKKWWEKKRKGSLRSDLKCFCSHFWGHLNWQEEGKSVLVFFLPLRGK